jgi:hypothetical protein
MSDVLFTQADLNRYVAVGEQLDDLELEKEELRARFIAAAQKVKDANPGVEGKAFHKLLAGVTEPGSVKVEVGLGTKKSTAWKSVVDMIEGKDCSFVNDQKEIVKLNSVMEELVSSKTDDDVPNDRVSVKPTAKAE